MVGKAVNIATQPILAGAWSELGNSASKHLKLSEKKKENMSLRPHKEFLYRNKLLPPPAYLTRAEH